MKKQFTQTGYLIHEREGKPDEQGKKKYYYTLITDEDASEVSSENKIDSKYVTVLEENKNKKHEFLTTLITFAKNGRSGAFIVLDSVVLK